MPLTTGLVDAAYHQVCRHVRGGELLAHPASQSLETNERRCAMQGWLIHRRSAFALVPARRQMQKVAIQVATEAMAAENAEEKDVRVVQAAPASAGYEPLGANLPPPRLLTVEDRCELTRATHRLRPISRRTLTSGTVRRGTPLSARVSRRFLASLLVHKVGHP